MRRLSIAAVFICLANPVLRAQDHQPPPSQHPITDSTLHTESFDSTITGPPQLIAALRQAVANGVKVQEKTTSYDVVSCQDTVDRKARFDEARSPLMPYPFALGHAYVPGHVRARFVIDTTGHADMSTVKILQSTDSGLTQSVVAKLPELRYFPARKDGHKVRTCVQQNFDFIICSLP